MGRPAEDLTGKKFNRLTVIRRATEEEWPRGNGYHAKWYCQCECGNFIFVQSAELKNGRTKSCGCFAKECAAKLAYNLGINNLNNLVGQKFNMLTVIKRDTNKPKKTFWVCRCDCGNYTSVEGTNLTSGHTKSCGCLRDIWRSHGEQKIDSILTENNIYFVREKTFEDLHGKSGSYLRFDFYIPDKKIAIEFNGEGHYEQTKRFHKTRQEFLAAQERDRRKISYCLANEITIYCIPYWEIDSIDSVEGLFKEKYIARTKWKNDEDWRAYKEKGEGK